MKLYSYFRSSAAYRVRIALNLKRLDCEIIPVNLLESEQKSDQYRSVNPQGLVPALVHEENPLNQSMAILEWLEAEQPLPPLLPGTSWERARIRSLAYLISCDVHPLNNLRVLKYLQDELNISDEQKQQWYHHWIIEGFTALEQQIERNDYCVGTSPTLADICLIPQVYNALRFKVPMDDFPKISAIYQHCNRLEAFKRAAP